MLFDQYGYILHNNDIDENGCIIKPHYHFYGRFQNPHTLSSVHKQLSDFNISEQQIDVVNNFRGAIRYLIHTNNPDKYQYSPFDVVSNIENITYYYFDVSEGSQVLDLIAQRNKGASLTSLIKYSISKNCYSTFRRNYKIIREASEENFSHDIIHSEVYGYPDGFEYCDSDQNFND